MALLFITPGAPAAAAANTAASLRQGGSLALVAQTTVMLPDGSFNAQLRIAGATADHTLDAEVYDRTTSRSAFTRSLDTEANLGQPIHRVASRPIGELRSANTGLTTLRIETHATGDEADSVRVSDRAGVYPVRITLRDIDGEIADRLSTHMIIAPRQREPGTLAYTVGLYVEIDGPVALQTSRQIVPDPVARERARLLIEALANEPLAAASIVPTPEFIWSLRSSQTPEDQDLAQLLPTIANGREVIGGPYVSVDEEVWRAAGLADRYQRLTDIGRSRVKEAMQLAEAPTTAIRMVQPSDEAATLAELATTGVARFIIPPNRASGIDPENFPITLSRPFDLTDQNNRRIGRASALDAQLHSYFGGSDNAVLDAHRLLADLTVLALDQPGLARGTIVAPPADWTPNAEFLTIFLNGLRRSPVLQPTTVSDYFAAVNPAAADGTDDLGAGVLRRALRDGTESGTPLGTYPGDIFAATEALRSYAEVVTPNDELPVLEELLLVTASVDFDPETRATYIEEVYRDIRSITNSVRGPEPQLISITARDFAIPFSVENTLDVAINAVLILDSDKLEFPDGASITKRLQPGVNDFEINVRAKTTGDSLLQVTVRSPDHTLQLAPPGRFTVRSTVFSGLGLVISIAALVVLLTWWARQVWSKHRDRMRSRQAAAA